MIKRANERTNERAKRTKELKKEQTNERTNERNERTDKGTKERTNERKNYLAQYKNPSGFSILDLKMSLASQLLKLVGANFP